MWRRIVPTQPSVCYLSARPVFGTVRFSTAGTNVASAQTHSQPSISKEVLMKMRKQTGYSYVKCRKALLSCGGEQNYDQALRWIKETAVREGWDKAAKLSGRKASQGLIGLASVSDNTSVLIELNCETDFVARSTEFRHLVAELVNALQKHIPTLTDESSKLCLSNIAQDKLHLMDGRSAEEVIVSTVAKVGENIRLARASIVSASPSNKLFGQTHPKEELNGVQLGRFVSLVSLSQKSEVDNSSVLPPTQLGQQICQHIIGMAPECLGTPSKKTPQNTIAQAEDIEVEEQTTTTKGESDGAEEEEDLNASQVDLSELTRFNEDETQLLRQPFMLCPEQTVSDYLEQHGANIADFLRIEMGQENVSTTSDTII